MNWFLMTANVKKFTDMKFTKKINVRNLVFKEAKLILYSNVKIKNDFQYLYFSFLNVIPNIFLMDFFLNFSFF